MNKIITVKFGTKSKTYDYLLDESKIILSKGSKLKKINGTSKWGNLYTDVTVVNIKDIYGSIDDVPSHVTAYMDIDENSIISTYHLCRSDWKYVEENRKKAYGFRTLIDSDVRKLVETSHRLCYYADKKLVDQNMATINQTKDMMLHNIIALYDMQYSTIHSDHSSSALDDVIKDIKTSKDRAYVDECKNIVIASLVDSYMDNRCIDWENI